MPEEATWPRLMTGPHPRAVGSLGADLVAETQARTGTRPRWWQELVLTRLLETDASGALVWLVLLLTTARQVGKSWLLGDLNMWRIHQAARFGEDQLVMHTGKDLAVCREVQRPSRLWAKAREHQGYVVANRYGQEEVMTPDGSRWMVRAQDAVYGYGSTQAEVDEAWKVPAAVVDDGLEPTMAERTQPQLILASTAHRRATSLFPSRRTEAVAQLAAPEDVLLVEWSAHPEAEVTDRAAWRQASPHWSLARERLLASKLNRALAGEADADDPDEPDPVESFRAQYLNVWPAKRLKPARVREEPLVDPATWADARVPGGWTAQPVVAIEDWFGQGAAAASAGVLPDGRLVVRGETFATRAQAVQWAASQSALRLLVGASLFGSPELAEWPLEIPQEAVGSAETRSALATIRELLATRRLVHDDPDGSALTDQFTRALVVRNLSGLALAPRSLRSDLLRAAAWAVESAHRAPALAEPQIW